MTKPLHIRLLPLLAMANALAGGIVLWPHLFPDTASRPQDTALWTPYVTRPLDKATAMVLPDHSKVTLNSDTHIEVSFNARRREIRLARGDAEFEVEPDFNRPFKVIVDDTTVVVLGTAFAVHRDRLGEIETFVSEGRVDLETRFGAKELRAHQVARVSNGQVHALPPLAAGDCRLAWIRDQLCFGEGFPLSKAIAEFNRYNRLQLRIKQSTIDNINIGGVFDKYDPKSFAAGLQKFKVGYIVAGSDGPTAHVILLTDQAPDRIRDLAR